MINKGSVNITYDDIKIFKPWEQLRYGFVELSTTHALTDQLFISRYLYSLVLRAWSDTLSIVYDWSLNTSQIAEDYLRGNYWSSLLSYINNQEYLQPFHNWNTYTCCTSYSHACLLETSLGISKPQSFCGPRWQDSANHFLLGDFWWRSLGYGQYSLPVSRVSQDYVPLGILSIALQRTLHLVSTVNMLSFISYSKRESFIILRSRRNIVSIYMCCSFQRWCWFVGT